jgi:hypothetical protein
MRGDPVIEAEEFQAVMSGMQQLFPMAKALTPAALVTAWDTFPDRAKLDLNSEMLLYAAQQRTLDPDFPRETPPHIALLRYLYPVKRTTRTERGQEVVTDLPMFERGLRRDLASRMADPSQFHELVDQRPEHAPVQVPRLQPGVAEGNQPWQMSATQRQAHVERIAQTVDRLRAQKVDDCVWTPAQLKVGRWWFEKALQGFWTMETDGAVLAVAWAVRNPSWADELIALARGGELKPVAPDRVVAEFVGSR